MRCFMGASSASFMKDCCTQFARSWNQLAHDDNKCRRQGRSHFMNFIVG